MAQSLENNVLELIHNFEQDIKMNKVKPVEAEEKVNPEISDNDEIEM